MVGLSDLDGGGFSSFARDVSTDAAVVVGYSNFASVSEAVFWTSAGGMLGPGSRLDVSSATVASDPSTVPAATATLDVFRKSRRLGSVTLLLLKFKRSAGGNEPNVR